MASLEDLIPTVNKLQDVMYASGIDSLDLPILAVIGSQSSGKSSILETLVGRDFLPRGTGIVTRRPLILQLNNISASTGNFDDSENFVSASNELDSANSSNDEEWGEFLHKPGQRYYNFDEIRQEIENETSRIAGKNKGISKIPINLKIYSPHVLNLTLVDLPGITKVPIGEQPHDIEKQINNLLLDYIATPNCLILAVSPANVDLVNSESLKLAKEVDPQGRRTIGVITKLDLMDSGTNALDILLGKVYPLKLGFVGVVNRSQQDIQLNKTVREALDNEDSYFTKHPIYKSIASRCGTRYLAKLLNKTLMGHIRDKLPDIKTKLNTLITQTEKEIASYGDTAFINKENKAGLILQLMNIFAKNFISSIDGTSLDINTKELCGGARIYYIYNNIFGKTLQSIDPTTNLTITDIKTAIRNSTGPRATLFVPELAFDLLVKPQIKLLQEPSQRCVELVFEELMKICHSSSTSELARYPNLKNTLIDVVSELLRERLTPTHSYVDSLIDIHRAYINTNHPKFLSATEVMSEILAGREKKKEADKRLLSLKQEAELNRQNESDTESSVSIKNGSDAYLNQNQPEDLHSVYGNGNKSRNNVNGNDKDSFLNYFFGKDKESEDLRNKNGKYQDPESVLLNELHIDDIPRLDDSDKDTVLTDREELECELIRRLIISYFDIVREMIQDQVPKAIMCLLVNFTKETVQNRLVTELYKDSMVDSLLQEDETLAQERKNCEQLLVTYKKASSLVNNII